MPSDEMSAASSGGVRSSVSLTASTIVCTGSASASRTSALDRRTERGRPVARCRPRISISISLTSGHAEPSWTLMSSAVCWPIASP